MFANTRLSGKVLCAMLAAAVLAAVSQTHSANALPVAGLPVELSLHMSAVPGSLKVGSVVPVTVTVTGLNAHSGAFQVGIPGNQQLMSPNQKLINPTGDLNIWSPGSLRKGLVKKLTFSVTVQAPEGATGAGMWCLSSVAAPMLLKGPPAWTIEKNVCYRVVIP